MQYLLLIYGDQNGWESMSEEERGQVFQAYGTFTQELYDEAKKNGWNVISMKNDWKRVFAWEEK